MEESLKIEETGRVGDPPPVIQGLMDKLKEVADQFGYVEIDPKDVNGDFDGLSFAPRQEDLTLGALSFQQFGPTDLKISTNTGDEAVRGGLYQGRDSPDQYIIASAFKAEGHDKVSGISSVIGTYKLDEEKPYRQHISFEKLRLEPGDKSAEGLDRWLALTKDSNKTMDDQGVVNITLPQPIKGFRDFIYTEEDCQITIGNRGGISLVKRRQ